MIRPLLLSFSVLALLATFNMSMPAPAAAQYNSGLTYGGNSAYDTQRELERQLERQRRADERRARREEKQEAKRLEAQRQLEAEKAALLAKEAEDAALKEAAMKEAAMMDDSLSEDETNTPHHDVMMKEDTSPTEDGMKADAMTDTIVMSDATASDDMMKRDAKAEMIGKPDNCPSGTEPQDDGTCMLMN